MPPQDQPPANPVQPAPNPQPYQPPTMNSPGILPPTDPSGGYNTPPQTSPPKDSKMRVLVIGAVALLIIILGVALIATQGSNENPDQTSAQSKVIKGYTDDSGFSFVPPAGWNKDTNYPGAQVAYKKNYTGTTPAIPTSISVVGEDPKDRSLATFADDAAFVVQALASNYKQDSKTKSKANGREAYLVEAHFNLGDTEIKTMQLVTIKDKKGWIITGMGLASEWNNDKPAIKSALLTFKP